MRIWQCLNWKFSFKFHLLSTRRWNLHPLIVWTPHILALRIVQAMALECLREAVTDSYNLRLPISCSAPAFPNVRHQIRTHLTATSVFDATVRTFQGLNPRLTSPSRSPLTPTQVDFGMVLPGPDVEVRRFGVRLPSALGLHPPVSEATAELNRVEYPRKRVVGLKPERKSRNSGNVKGKACVGARADSVVSGNIVYCAYNAESSRGGTCSESAQRAATELDSR
jgi:hypothetical protein